MSSRRSDKDGTRIGTTDRRWNKSSRNAPSAIRPARSRRARRNDPHVDVDPRGATDAREVLLDENAKDLALGLLGHVGDFVDVQSAAVGLFEPADVATFTADALGAEELVFHRVRRMMVAALTTMNGPVRPTRRVRGSCVP